jgi:hypothetical protein
VAIDEFRENEPIWPCVCPACQGQHNQGWSKLDFLIDHLVGIREHGDSVRHSLDITMVLLGYLPESIGGYQSSGEKAREIETLLRSVETDICWSLDHHRNDIVP